MREPEGLRDFIDARSAALVRSATLLTGDEDVARDLLQETFVRVWPHWERVRHQQPEAYVRTTMLRLQQSRWRRRWTGETPTADLPERAGEDRTVGVDDRLALTAALLALPVGQRQVVVLRYVEDRSVAEVAALLRVHPGTVKSQAARGLATLRTIVGSADGREVVR
ncbi:SigE family RNA polymerase sigma factor [Janibacter melonis]|uniref:SigE family RNA polymerase sigma factor n=1 Tax=Janibacter melonis TaxID=262209 RepID=UPI002094B21A|nr:SigE family RNA polymerase sigma factor [Janibacter melonis]